MSKTTGAALALLTGIFLLIAGAALAQDPPLAEDPAQPAETLEIHPEPAYTTDAVDMMVRSGPGTQYRIIAVVKGGTPVTLLSQGEEYSFIRLDNVKEVYILSRFVTRDAPPSVLLPKIEAKLKQARARVKELTEENKRLLRKNRSLSADLTAMTKTAHNTQAELIALREDCSDCLKPIEELKEVKAELQIQKQRADQAEQKLSAMERNSGIHWFLAGAGVLFFGIILGLTHQRRRRTSSLLR